MRVIIGADSFDLDARAQKHLKAQQIKEEKYGGSPIGIAVSLSKYIHACDDCGLKYWDANEYGYAHIGCRGAPLKEKLGF